jgi:hypothetical protein
MLCKHQLFSFQIVKRVGAFPFLVPGDVYEAFPTSQQLANEVNDVNVRQKLHSFLNYVKVTWTHPVKARFPASLWTIYAVEGKFNSIRLNANEAV